jgi:putative DNA primase/helicase
MSRLTRLPSCLDHLAQSARWVGWRWEERKGRRTKPPRDVRGGRNGGYADSRDPATWATLDEARAAQADGLDGIGLQLLGLPGFAAVDLDDVRDPDSGVVLPWAVDLVARCESYAEMTPSGSGLRIIGAVAHDFPATHMGGRAHLSGGKFEVYANIATGRYITVTGDRLENAPDRLAPIDAMLRELLETAAPTAQPTLSIEAAPRVDQRMAFDALPSWLRDVITHGKTGDRSVDFQSAVNGLRARLPRDAALEILRTHPTGPASKYHGRLETEFLRSWGKAEAAQKAKTDAAPHHAEAPTEDQAALLLVERQGATLRYDHHASAWFRWDGACWRKDAADATMHALREIAREMTRRADAKTQAATRRASFVSGAERFARADPAFVVGSETWDRNPWLLGVPGGVVDLRAGVLRSACPDDHITRQAAIAPSRSSGCPQWLGFLDEACVGDVALVGYLQRLFGYALTGDTSEHALTFIHGPGGNGKSVFINTLSGLLGDYAATAPMDAFTASRSERHPTDLAMLRGARLVTASETEEGRAWAESRIKQITGGDPITARFMRQDFFTYRPQFKLVIVGNHKPVLRNVDDALRRRFHIISFPRKPARPDRGLERKLRAEWPAIMAWAIEGCLAWRRDGLAPPPAVLAETEAYFGAQDVLGQWIEDACIVALGDENRWESVDALYTSWSNHAVAAGEKAGAKKVLGEALDRRGFMASKKKINGRQIRVRMGLSLRGG